jgi:iron complex outermembrane recepter protein
MSEFLNTSNDRKGFRRRLLTTVSTLTLLGSVYAAGDVKAADDDGDRPVVWLELGGQFEQVATAQEIYAPAFFTPQPSFTSFTPKLTEKPLDFSFGGEGKITLQPEDSNWVFSAAVRYGRSAGHEHIHQSTPDPIGKVYINGHFVGSAVQREPKFVDATAAKSQTYGILDFQAGKDVGLGLFGKDSQSIISVGVRLAQFKSNLRETLGLDPNNGGYKYFTQYTNKIKAPVNNPHDFSADFNSTRSFHGLGPILSWSGSAPVAGSSGNMEFAIDWGANAALLFGRQRTAVHHQETAYTHPGGNQPYLVYRHIPSDSVRSRSVTVPNLGGFAGASFRYLNAKVSFGYRADFFWGAMDGGIDTAKKENIGFYGPFASVSVGIGG